MQRTRDKSRFVVVCQYTDAGAVEANLHWNTNRKHLEIRGCWSNDFSPFYRGGGEGAGQTRGALYERFIDRKYSLEEAKQALADGEEPSD